MSNSKELKLLRGQIRQIVKEILPEVLSASLVEDVEKRLFGHLKEGLEKIDSRQKDLQAYMIRNGK